MKRPITWLPLVLFVAIAGVFLVMLLAPSNRVIQSRLIGKPVPAFVLPPGVASKPGLASRDLAQGKPRLLNLFASWCIPCAVESPQLMQLAKIGVPIDAVAIRDRPDDVRAFLERWGDPFQRIGSDTSSQVQLAVGSSGVPETFIVDGQGIIRYQHIGDIRPEHIPEILRQYEAAR